MKQQKSVFEINKITLEAHLKVKALSYPHAADSHSAGYADSNGIYHWFDFCSSWADAGPIIRKEKISLIPTNNPEMPDEWLAKVKLTNGDNICAYANHPLEAAMLVYTLRVKLER